MAPTYVLGPVDITGNSNYAYHSVSTNGSSILNTDFPTFFSYKYNTATDWSASVGFRPTKVDKKQILIWSCTSASPSGNDASAALNLFNNYIDQDAKPPYAYSWDGWMLWIDDDNHPVITFTKTKQTYTKCEASSTGSVTGWNDYVKFDQITIEANKEYNLKVECTSAGNFKATCTGDLSKTQTGHFALAANYKSSYSPYFSECGICNTGWGMGYRGEQRFILGTKTIYIKSFSVSGTKAGGPADGPGTTGTINNYAPAYAITSKSSASWSASSYEDSMRTNKSYIGEEQTYTSSGSIALTSDCPGLSNLYVANFRASMVKVDKNNSNATAKTGADNNYYAAYDSGNAVYYRYFLNDSFNNEVMVWPVFTDIITNKKLKGFGDAADSTTVHANGIKARNSSILGNSLGSETTEFAIWGNVVFIPNVDQEYTYNAESQGIGAPNTEAKARQYCNGYDEIKYNLPMTGDGGYCTITTSKFTNAGTYTITFNLKSGSGAVWSDGTTSAKTVSLVINKKPLTLPKFNTTVKYNAAKYKTTVTYTNSSDGMSNRILGSDVLKITYTTQYADAGVYKQENATSTKLNVSYSVNVSNNYEWSLPSGNLVTITIKKRDLTITTKGHTWVYNDGYNYWRGDGDEYFTYDKYTTSGFVSADSGAGCANGCEIHTTTDFTTYWTSNIMKVSDSPVQNAPTQNAFRELLPSGSYKDITKNYNVTIVTGNLELTKRPVILTTGSGAFPADGSEHGVASVIDSAIDGNTESGLCAGTTLEYPDITDSTTWVKESATGTYQNKPKKTSTIKIMKNGTNITSRYDITWVYGTIEIKAGLLVFTTTLNSAEASRSKASGTDKWPGGVIQNNSKEYDGNSLPAYPLYYSGAWLADDHIMVLKNIRVSYDAVPSSYPGIGGCGYWDEAQVQDLINGVAMRINNGAGTNVNKLYDGNNWQDVPIPDRNVRWIATPISITPRKITIVNKPETKVYDGTEIVHSYVSNNTGDVYIDENVHPGATGEGEVGNELCWPTGGALKHTLEISDVKAGPNVGLWPDKKPSNGVITGSKSNAELTTPIDITANYNITYLGGDMQITARPITYTVVGNTKVYDGTPLIATVTRSGYTADSGLVPGQTDEISEVSVGPEVGVWNDCVPESIMIKPPSGRATTGNYDITLVGGDLSITKKSVTITNASESKTYDGTPLVHSVENGKITASGLLTGHTFAVNDLSYGPDFGTASMVPANAIIYDSEGTPVTGNYDITYVAGTMTITKANVTISNTTETKVYDGTELNHTVANGKVTHTAVPSGCTVEASAKFGPAVGTSNVNVTYDIKKNGVSVLSNFVVTTAPAQMTITSRPITIKNKDGAKSYDGEALVHSYYNNNTGEIYISSGSLALGQSMTVPAISVGPTAGTYTGTPAGAVIRDDEGNVVTSNYNPTYVAGTMTISENALVITVAGSTKVYDGTKLSVTPTYTGALNEGDTITFHPVEKGPDVGTWNSTVAEWPTHYEIKDSEGKDHHGNYTIQTVGGNLSITKKPLTPVWSTPLTKVYDGTILSISAVPNPAELVAAGDVTAFTVDIDHVGPNVTAATGTYTSKVTGLVGPKASNYDIPASAADRISGWYSITKKPLTITNATGTKIYDGSPLVHSTDNGKITATGLLSGHIMTIPSISKGKDSGAWTAAQCTPSGAIIKIDNSEGTIVTGNYDITYVGNTMSITRRAVALTWSMPETKGYDGTTLPINCTIGNKISGDDVSVTYNPTAAGPNIGSYTATATALTGAQSGNYKLPTSGLTHTYMITAGTGVTIPTINPTDYNLTGSTINAQVYNYPNTKISASGTLSASEPGEYHVVFHLIDPNDCWDDSEGSKDDIELVWRIIGYKVHVWQSDNAWHDYMPYYWDGTQWRLTKPYYWNGTQWVLCGR